ncbi:hypothetical protein MN202_19085 [Rheinheimera muenzenbergensis]|uniref:Uncharacterized protein n=1 Tax=Rheinheimera muenzenbergensis TaxID=1193628 RepID=A0ABU8CBI5_9GAMM
MDFLKPQSYNKTQKVGAFSVIVSIITMLFIHFPFKGYYIYESGDCLQWGIRYCEKYEQSIKSPFDWQSRGALIEWFGNITNLMALISFVLVIGVFFVYFFKEEKNKV